MYITKPCQHWKREIWWLVSGSSNTQILNLRFKKIIKQRKKIKTDAFWWLLYRFMRGAVIWVCQCLHMVGDNAVEQR
ncbi:hypothetical protein DZI72_12735 [Escherichia coli]|nr:hypothetical protein [Escherichia coli]